jgi:hypothetical protein
VIGVASDEHCTQFERRLRHAAQRYLGLRKQLVLIRQGEVISGHQRSSEVIRGHKRSSEVIRG